MTAPRVSGRCARRVVALLPLAVAALAALAAVACSAARGAPGVAPVPPHYSAVPVPADAYEPPYPPDHRVGLSNGAVAYLVPDSTLDVVRLFLYAAVPGQPARPADAVRHHLYSALLKDGGTRALAPTVLEDSLEFIAAALSAGRGAWQGEASFDALGKDATAMLDLLADVLLEPRLDPAAFEVARRRLQEGHRIRYSAPSGVMAALSERVLHGSHPANWTPTAAEIAAVKPRDLVPLSGSGFPRERLVIGVAGRFDRDAMIAALERFTARFPAGSRATPDTVPPFPGMRAPGVYLVDKPFAQAGIQVAAPGVRRPHPDYYRLLLASEVFGGGGFTSRLALRVRSDEGLAYSVSSWVDSDYHRRGTVRVGLQTKAETGTLAVDIVRGEMRRMAEEGITDAELERARESLLKSLPSLFSTPASTARIFAQSEAWGRSPEHFRDYRKALETMTRAEVEDAFRRYFVADSMRILVVGPAKTLLAPDARGRSLADVGPVTQVTEEELDRRE